MFFSFKEKIEDFIVQEELAFNLDWIGDFFFVLFEKRGKNTMEIINQLCDSYKLERKELGIAWLKDKDWITQQWLSIGERVLKRIWWEKNFLNTLLGEDVRILDISRHSEPLSVGKNKGNFFTIRLRNKTKITDNIKETLERKLKECLSFWFPNTFWIQRFGKGNKNYKKALKFFQTWKDLTDTYEVKFKLQAFWSMWFNEYVMKRVEDKNYLLEGDIMVNWWNAFWTQVAVLKNWKLSHFDYWKSKEKIEGKDFREPNEYTRESDNSSLWNPTGFVLWTEQLLCPSWSLSRKYDNLILEESWFINHGTKISKRYRLYGFRRPLFVIPKNLERRRDGSNFILNFFLPTGSYATSFLAHILWEIDPDGCIENGLIIPRPVIEK